MDESFLEVTVNCWELHRFSLSTEEGRQVLRQEVSELRISCDKHERFAATFELGEQGSKPDPLRICLRRHLLGGESWIGETDRGGKLHSTRIVHMDDRQTGAQALVGHLTRDDSGGNSENMEGRWGTRDFFLATRTECPPQPKGPNAVPAPFRPRRVTTPFVDQAYEFTTRLEMPLDETKPASLGGALRLSHGSLVIEPFAYSIALELGDSGGLHFRTEIEENVHSVGGLVLPLDAAGKHLLLLCYRHLHEPRRHDITRGDVSGDRRGDVPGHPICTNVLTGVQTY